MDKPDVRSYVVVLQNERVAPERRGELREQTKSAFGSIARKFARDISMKVDQGALPGVISVGESRSGALPIVFIQATEDGAQMLLQDKRVKAISAS